MEISSSARIFGTPRLGRDVVIAQGSVIRSVEDSVSIGNTSWVLENSTVIGTSKYPVTIGQKTVFGHKCVVIGAQIGSLCEVGNATLFLPGCKVGNMCMFGEGTIITPNMIIPDYSVVLGRPGRIIRTLTDKDKNMIKRMRGNNITLDTENFNSETTIKGSAKMSKLYAYQDKFPSIAKTAMIFDSAEITGDVTIGEHSVIGAGVKIIGNSHGPVIIGNNVQILENTVLHLLPDNKLVLHDHVTIGPQCMIHGTIVGENTVIEAGAIVCDNSMLGPNTLVKSGSLVKQRDTFEENAIVEGFPAVKIGENTVLQPRPDWAIRKTI